MTLLLFFAHGFMCWSRDVHRVYKEKIEGEGWAYEAIAGVVTLIFCALFAGLFLLVARNL